uniref:Uncharacterized protein n=1 Tax=Arundo donax TaxID=35708 RepID=A0A0A8YUL2_ARUDO
MLCNTWILVTTNYLALYHISWEI